MKNIFFLPIAFTSFMAIYFLGLITDVDKMCTFGLIGSGVSVGYFLRLVYDDLNKLAKDIKFLISFSLGIIFELSFVIIDGVYKDKIIVSILGLFSVLFFFINIYMLKSIQGK